MQQPDAHTTTEVPPTTTKKSSMTFVGTSVKERVGSRWRNETMRCICSHGTTPGFVGDPSLHASTSVITCSWTLATGRSFAPFALGCFMCSICASPPPHSLFRGYGTDGASSIRIRRVGYFLGINCQSSRIVGHHHSQGLPCLASIIPQYLYIIRRSVVARILSFHGPLVP